MLFCLIREMVTLSKNLKGTLSKITKWFYKDGSSAVITGGYMNTDPSYPTPPHQGVDYRARTPIELVSPVDSIVIATDAAGASGYGRFIYLYLPNIDETIMFAHLSRILVSVGDKLKKGATIGFTGSTGTSAAHLHFGRAKGRTTNMNKYLDNAKTKWGWLDPELIDFNKTSNPNEGWTEELNHELVLKQRVNLREGPNTSSKIIRTLEKGARVPYTHYKDAGGYDWKKTVDGHYIASGTDNNNKLYADIVPVKVPDKPKLKSNRVIADEVKLGRWGNGADRVKRLTDAGYDPKAIQDIVDADNGKKPVQGLRVGDVVKIKPNAYYQGQSSDKKVSQVAYNKPKLTINKIDGDNARIAEITSWIALKDLTKA